jgi:predicted CopG family antitoxin
METTNEFKNISVKIDTFQILYKMKGREGNITWDDVIKYLIRRERENESKSQSEKHAKLLQEFRGAAIQK